MSYTGPKVNRLWAEKMGFHFEVWTDSARTLAKAAGAASAMPVPRRLTVLLDAEARVVVRYPEVVIGTHPGQVLEDARVLFGPEEGAPEP